MAFERNGAIYYKTRKEVEKARRKGDIVYYSEKYKGYYINWKRDLERHKKKTQKWFHRSLFGSLVMVLSVVVTAFLGSSFDFLGAWFFVAGFLLAVVGIIKIYFQMRRSEKKLKELEKELGVLP